MPSTLMPLNPLEIQQSQKELYAMSNQPERVLIEKLRTLPPERLAEVEDFVDFLRGRD